MENNHISNKGETNILEISRNKRDGHLNITVTITGIIISSIGYYLGLDINQATFLFGILVTFLKFPLAYLNRKYNIYRVDGDGNFRLNDRIIDQSISFKIK